MNGGQDGIDSIVTCCGLVNESQWGEIFCTIWLALRPSQCPVLGVQQL